MVGSSCLWDFWVEESSRHWKIIFFWEERVCPPLAGNRAGRAEPARKPGRRGPSPLLTPDFPGLPWEMAESRLLPA